MTHEHVEAVIAKLERGEYGKGLPMVDNVYCRREYGTKKASVMQAIMDHPEAGPTKIARMVGCVPGYVCNLKAEMGR